MADQMKSIARNPKATYDFSILETFEAGLVLTGTEIKSIRAGRVNLREAFARPQDGELWLHGTHIALWPGAAANNHEPTRPRKLLLHKSQLISLTSKVEQRGMTLVPLRVYITRHRAKVEIALAKGKKRYDRRETIKKRDIEREMRQALKLKV